MKIGEFVQQCRTTKDAVRYYEELGLILPQRGPSFKEYGEDELSDFQAIKEMQQLGMSLKIIQSIFSIKRIKKCGSSVLIKTILEQLKKERLKLSTEEQSIRRKKKDIDQLIETLQNTQLIEEERAANDRENL